MKALDSLIDVMGGGDGSDAARRRQLIAMAGIYDVVALLIGTLSGGYWRINLTAAYATMLALMGVNLLFGQLGLVSLCQFALVGVGGWVTLRLAHLGWPFEIATLAGGIAACVVGVVWGLPALRLRGVALALVTLMLAGAFQTIINSWNFPAGGTGFFGTADLEAGGRKLMARPLLAEGDTAYFYYVAFVGFLGLLAVELHRSAKPGRAWALIANSPQLAQVSGVSVLLYQAWAFALAGFLSGIGGGLLAGVYRALDASGFRVAESIVLFAGAVLGGASNWVGSLAGALLVKLVPLILDEFGASASVGTAIFGFALMMAIVDSPDGLAGAFDRLVDRRARRARR
jgi:branched-chain amino acid transport system permease protein